jgi:hypothetical protein
MSESCSRSNSISMSEMATLKMHRTRLLNMQLALLQAWWNVSFLLLAWENTTVQYTVGVLYCNHTTAVQPWLVSLPQHMHMSSEESPNANRVTLQPSTNFMQKLLAKTKVMPEKVHYPPISAAWDILPRKWPHQSSFLRGADCSSHSILQYLQLINSSVLCLHLSLLMIYPVAVFLSIFHTC